MRAFWAKLSKKAIFWTPPQQKRRFWLIIENQLGFLARNCSEKRRNRSDRDMAQSSTCGWLGLVWLGLVWATIKIMTPQNAAIFYAWRFGDLKLSEVAPANQTKELSVHELFAGAFQNKSSMWIVLVFLRKNTRIHKNGRTSWTFRFGPFFGLVCWGDSWNSSLPWIRNARLFIILFVRNFWRVCAQFWLSVRNSVWGPFNRNSGGNPSLCWLGGGGGFKGRENCEQTFCEQTCVSYWRCYTHKTWDCGSEGLFSLVVTKESRNQLPKPKDEHCQGNQTFKPLTSLFFFHCVLQLQGQGQTCVTTLVIKRHKPMLHVW